MTDPRGPWELAPEGTYPVEEGYKVLGPWRETKAGHKTRSYVAQFMTKADAEFLVRAQHLDELVAALQRARKYVYGPDLAVVDTALAKIALAGS